MVRKKRGKKGGKPGPQKIKQGSKKGKKGVLGLSVFPVMNPLLRCSCCNPPRDACLAWSSEPSRLEGF